jgi:hypothetical protein
MLATVEGCDGACDFSLFQATELPVQRPSVAAVPELRLGARLKERPLLLEVFPLLVREFLEPGRKEGHTDTFAAVKAFPYGAMAVVSSHLEGVLPLRLPSDRLAY